MKSGPAPAFVLARVCAPAAQARLPVSGSGCGRSACGSRETPGRSLGGALSVEHL